MKPNPKIEWVEQEPTFYPCNPTFPARAFWAFLGRKRLVLKVEESPFETEFGHAWEAKAVGFGTGSEARGQFLSLDLAKVAAERCGARLLTRARRDVNKACDEFVALLGAAAARPSEKGGER